MRTVGRQHLYNLQSAGAATKLLPMSSDIQQRPDFAQAVRLLEGASLPTADLTERHMEDFFYAGADGPPLGIVGVEAYGADALLRSLVVLPSQRSRGIGRRLLERAEQHARERGVSTMYLLTTTAESFFLSHGYDTTARDSAPLAIRSTREFSSLCPASSAFLSKRL